MNSKGHRSGMWRWSDTDWDNKIAISLESIRRRGARLEPAGKRELLSVIYHGRNPDAYLAMERSWGSFEDNGTLPPRPQWFQTLGAQHPVYLPQPGVHPVLEDTGAGPGAQDHLPATELLLLLAKRIESLENELQASKSQIADLQEQLGSK